MLANNDIIKEIAELLPREVLLLFDISFVNA